MWQETLSPGDCVLTLCNTITLYPNLNHNPKPNLNVPHTALTYSDNSVIFQINVLQPTFISNGGTESFEDRFSDTGVAGYPPPSY